MNVLTAAAPRRGFRRPRRDETLDWPAASAEASIGRVNNTQLFLSRVKERGAGGEPRGERRRRTTASRLFQAR